MCGIAGIYHRDRNAEVDAGLIKAMTDRLVHRGPDDGGAISLGAAGLGHRRLSILDLSPAGHQPMSAADERWWITFNGEIYNYQALREDLEARGVRFRTSTDTEVLLHLYAREGAACLERLNGMFAFAIYDTVDHVLFLARDRVGKKPLYVWDDGDRIAFASELKAFFADPAFRPTLDPRAIADLLSTQYLPDPNTCYREVQRLEPAHYHLVTSDRTLRRRYWQVPLQPRTTPLRAEEGALERTVDELEALFTDAVRLRMVADVPLGAFLSGGVDSSAVVGAMSRCSSLPIKTTAIAFDITAHDESRFAAEVARRFACDHHSETVRADAAELLETLLWHFDEPFADPSALPTYLLSRVTRQRVTVALSGDGGDEAFGGYRKYAADRREQQLRSMLPGAAWQGLLELTTRVPLADSRWWRRGVGLLRTLSDDPASAYFRTQSTTPPEEVAELLSADVHAALGSYDPRVHTRTVFSEADGSDPLSTRQVVDIATYLPGDILTKVDRMSMAHALEVRCPLLDHRILEFALRLPPSFRLHHGSGKRVLKRMLERHLPRTFIDRPKHGFDIPVDEWLRGPLLPLFRSTLFDGRIRHSGLLEMRRVERMLTQHLEQRAPHGETLWTLLQLGLWYDRIMGNRDMRLVAGMPTRIDSVRPLKRAV